ncbi:MAG: hypothetical protein LUG16_01430 [Candidatus Gastranaerophilales bacterium]|nr:hypothetical protein [Candidatus Gastranaerophilales bacterium]
MRNKNEISELVEEKMHSVGTDISLIESLMNFLCCGLNDDIEVENADVANIASVTYSLIKDLKLRFDEIENALNI